MGYEVVRAVCVTKGGSALEESEVVRGEVHRNGGSVWGHVRHLVEVGPLGFSHHVPWSMSL